LKRGWTPEQINQRIVAQMPVDQKIARADFVVWTDGGLDMHTRQIERILARLCLLDFIKRGPPSAGLNLSALG
jgi:dephospho-CoA kinase